MQFLYRWGIVLGTAELKVNDPWDLGQEIHIQGEIVDMQTDKHTSAKSLQSCPTLCDPIGGSPPGSPIPGILQARTLEWGAIAFSDKYTNRQL